MEIRRLLRGENIDYAAARQVQNGQETVEKTAAGASRPSSDRLELSRQWVEVMEEQRTRLEAALSQPTDPEKKSNGILDMLDQTSAEEEELDALSKELDVQMKCLKIAMNIMKGKRVPPEDERFLMENDPDGYKLAMAMRSLVKEDDEECESVLKDEEEEGGETSETEESAPVEGGGDGGEAAVSDGGDVE